MGPGLQTIPEPFPATYNYLKSPTHPWPFPGVPLAPIWSTPGQSLAVSEPRPGPTIHLIRDSRVKRVRVRAKHSKWFVLRLVSIGVGTIWSAFQRGGYAAQGYDISYDHATQDLLSNAGMKSAVSLALRLRPRAAMAHYATVRVECSDWIRSNECPKSRMRDIQNETRVATGR